MSWKVLGSCVGTGKNFVPPPKNREGFWGPKSLLHNGCLVTSWGKADGVKFNISTVSSCEIKNEWSYTSPPESPQYTICPDVTEVLHLVITKLVFKILLTTCRNLWYLCSRYGWFDTCTRRSPVEGHRVSCVHGVYGATHKDVYERPQHLQQVQRECHMLSYMQSQLFSDQEFNSGKHRQKTEVPLH